MQPAALFLFGRVLGRLFVARDGRRLVALAFVRHAQMLIRGVEVRLFGTAGSAGMLS